jgi:hypothetical protein
MELSGFIVTTDTKDSRTVIKNGNSQSNKTQT